MIGMPQIILILVLLILFFGAKRIPALAGSLAQSIKEFKKVSNEDDSNISQG
ncbi:MAG: twin-arginine translocase TatA/TatE family subunit [Planctomycetes bacterium]|nr:twin-arginine translocase TatA/TatE family subunit [Planctomycetota bacterium]